MFGKGDECVVDRINNGLATYMNKEKTLSFLFHKSAPIAASTRQKALNYLHHSALYAEALRVI